MATMSNFLAKPMATINFLAKPVATVIPRPTSAVASTSSFQFLETKPNSLTLKQRNWTKNTPRKRFFITLKPGAASPGTVGSPAAKDEKVVKIHSGEEFDEALKNAKSKLVVVEFATSKSDQSNKIYPFMVELSRTCNDVVFLLVVGDESDKTRELCRREKIEKVPHFSFYKSMEKIHEEDAIEPDQLMGDVLYYGDNHSAVVQLHGRTDVEKLIDENKVGGKMIVLDVGLKHCGPCVKVYPTVLKLSSRDISKKERRSSWRLGFSNFLITFSAAGRHGGAGNWRQGGFSGQEGRKTEGGRGWKSGGDDRSQKGPEADDVVFYSPEPNPKAE